MSMSLLHSFSMFSIQQVLWDTTRIYPPNVSQPSGVSLAQDNVYTGDAYILQDLRVGHLVLPANMQQVSEAELIRIFLSFMLHLVEC